MAKQTTPKKTSPKKPLEGLGDVIKVITNAVGIPTCDTCEERRKKLNDMFSFLRAVQRDLTPEEVEYVKQCHESNRISDTARFTKIYNEVFGMHVQNCNCPGVHGEFLVKLMKQIQKQEITTDDTN